MTYLKMAVRNLVRRPSRTLLTILAISVAVSLMVLLTSVSLGLKAQSVQTGSVDFWVIPPGSDVMDPITGSQQTMLGNVHTELGPLLADPSVDGASPVLNRIVYAQSGTNNTRIVLAVGVIPGAIQAMPASSAGFSRGDTFFYGGAWTGEVVVNQVAADLLGTRVGDLLYLDISRTLSRSFHVVQVIDTLEYFHYPVVVLHLSELQEITGDLENDRANQILVDGTHAGPFLRDLYPQHLVLSRSEYTTNTIVSDTRILATAAAASVLAFVMGFLFIGTAMVMSVTERKREMAMMSAIGISRRSILTIVFYESLVISLAGGMMGMVLTFAGNRVLNTLLLHIVGITGNPVNDPVLLLGGCAVALLSGLTAGISVSLFTKWSDLSRAF